MRNVVLTSLVLLIPAFAMGQTQRAPALTLRDTNGRQFRLSDYKGKVVLLNFWATWCPPCRTEIPDLIRMQRKYRNKGLRIVGITYPPQEVSEIQRFAREARMNYRVCIGTKATKELFTTSATLPVTVVIDRDGSVSEVIEGILYSDEFDQKVKPLLLAKPQDPTHARSTR